MVDKLEIVANNYANTDLEMRRIKEIIKDVYKQGFKRGVSKIKDDNRFSPEDVYDIIVNYGQHDQRFRLGETIKYSPSEIMRILKGEDA